jgi:hypothetical protein
MEEKTYEVLIERRIIRKKGMLLDATVFPEAIKYPNDVGLLNDVREWLVRSIHKLGKALGEKRPRTYKRKARQEYLKFSKKKTKTKKTIARAKKAMLQYVRRNLRLKREAFNESEFAVAQIGAYQERFGELPPYLAADRKYGTRENREEIDKLGIQTSFVPLGRTSREI